MAHKTMVLGETDMRCANTRRVIMPVNTTDNMVNIMFIACGHITLKPKIFHNTRIIREKPGKTTPSYSVLRSYSYNANL